MRRCLRYDGRYLGTWSLATAVPQVGSGRQLAGSDGSFVPHLMLRAYFK